VQFQHPPNSDTRSNNNNMKKRYYLIILMLTCRICLAQNLIPNGDLEQHTYCPTGYGQFASNVVSWMTPSTNLMGSTGTPDYFHVCSSATGVPNNYLGHQMPHSGDAYCGITLWYLTASPNFREYIEVPLMSSLLPETCYHFEMYVNLGNICAYTTYDMGVYFSDTALTNINNALPLPFVPQINNAPSNVFDTLNWTLVTGDYTATGGESYLIIGNFKDDSSTTVFPTGAYYESIYCMIDDVFLSICTTGIDGSFPDPEVNIYPNPVKDQLNVEVNSHESSEIVLYDIASRKILQQEFTNFVSLNTERLAKGIYFYRVQNTSDMLRKGKLVKE
jgi:hypothetical protein